MIRSVAYKLLRNFNFLPINHLPNFVSQPHFDNPSLYFRDSYLLTGVGKYCFATKGSINKQQKQQKPPSKQHSKGNSKFANSQKSFKPQSKTSPKPNKNNHQNKQPKLKSQIQNVSSPQANPKIAELNSQISLFIQVHTSPITTQSPKDSNQIQISQKITSQTLSNLYRLISMKAEFLGMNAMQGLSQENRVKIDGMLKTKVSGVEELMKGNEGEVKRWSLTQHEEMCDVVYLSALVGEKKIHSNVKSEFLQYLNSLPSEIKTPDSKTTQVKLCFTQKPPQSISESTMLPILIPQMFPAHMILANSDNFASQIIRMTIEYRSIGEMIDVMKALGRLLTVKQLRSLDRMLVEVLDRNGRKMGVQTENTDSGKILTIDDMIKLASILSQLSLNGSVIQQCQSIFSQILYSETSDYTQLLNELPIILSTPSLSSLSATSEFFTPLLKFDQIMKMYIAVGELGAVDRDLQYLVEKMFAVKLKLTQMIDLCKQVIENAKLWKEMRAKYGISEKEVSILVSTLHKFKKGSELVMVKTPQLPPHLNSHNSAFEQFTHLSNKVAHSTIWLSIYKFYTSHHNIPQQFIFSLMSGLYRSFTPLVLNALHDCKLRKKVDESQVMDLCEVMNEALSKLVFKLYEADEELTYVEELKVEKLIEFVLVGEMAMVAGVLGNLKHLGKLADSNVKILEPRTEVKTNTLFYSTLIDKLLTQLQKNKHHSRSPQNEHQQSQQFQEEPLQVNPPLTRKQLQHKQEIYALLEFYLLYGKAHVELLTVRKSQKTENVKKISEMMIKARDVLKRVKMSEEVAVLVSALVKNGIELAHCLKELANNQSHSKQKSQKLHSLSQSWLSFGSQLQSFIGFTSSSPFNEYTSQLQSGLLITVFPHMNSEQQNISKLSSQLLCVDGEKGEFGFEKYLMNRMLIMEEMIRVKLIRDENEFRQYENMDAEGNGEGKEE